MANLALIVICLLLGVGLRASGRVSADGARAVGTVAIFLSLPALTLTSLRSLRVAGGARELLAAIAMAWLVFIAGALVFAWLGRRAHWPAPAVGALVLTAGLGNTSFVGFPLVETLFGKRALAVAVLNDQPGTFLVLATLGTLAAGYFSPSRGRPNAAAVARKVITFPPFVALVLALATRPWPFPAAIDALLARIAETLVPLALVSVGLHLRPDAAALRRYRGPLAAGLVYKLALAPALTLLFAAGILGVRGETLRVTVVEAAMAPMVTGALVAADYELAPDLATLLVGVGIPLSLVSVPIWSWWLARAFG